jgi:hypothetical protein
MELSDRRLGGPLPVAFVLCAGHGEALKQVISYSEGVRHDRQRRIYGCTRREKAAIDDVQVVEVVGLAVGVER